MSTAATAPVGPAFTTGEAPPRRGLGAMTLLALGVVYGDIGTARSTR